MSVSFIVNWFFNQLCGDAIAIIPPLCGLYFLRGLVTI